MNKETETKFKPIMREVEIYKYMGVTCPHCKKRICIPVYYQQPGTPEDARNFDLEVKKNLGY